MSVRPSVCHTPVGLLYLNGADTQFQGEPGVKYTGVGRFCDFETEITVYLGNGYCGT